MAKFDFHRIKAGLNIESLNGTVFNYKMLKDLPIASKSADGFTIDPPGSIAWNYKGTSIKYDSKGDPKKGIITSIETSGPSATKFSITGISLDIAELKSVLKTGTKVDDLLLINSIFAGDDIIKGGRGGDKLFGLGGNDEIRGGDGVDTLKGGDGNDTIFGGKGNDKLSGGSGADTFVFNTNIKTSTPNVDKISDFSAAEDKIQVDDQYFAGLSPGALADANFAIGKPGLAKSADARIVYDDTTGDLYYDAPGSKPMYKFAHLDGAPTLTAAHFEII